MGTVGTVWGRDGRKSTQVATLEDPTVLLGRKTVYVECPQPLGDHEVPLGRTASREGTLASDDMGCGLYLA